MVAKDYSKIAAARIIRPAETRRKPKVLVYGRNKKGKSTFALSAGVDRTLVIDPESGTSEMRTSNPHVWPVERWEDLDDAYEFLRAKLPCPTCKPQHFFEWVSVDGLTKISNMSLRYVMSIREGKALTEKPGQVDRRDYGRSGEMMKELLARFHNLDMGVIYTVQERQVDAAESEEDEEVESLASWFVPDLPKGVRGTVNSLVDVIARIYIVQVENSEGERRPQRRLWIGPSELYDTGYRSDYGDDLPSMLKNPTVPKLVRLLRTGSAVATPRKKV